MSDFLSPKYSILDFICPTGHPNRPGTPLKDLLAVVIHWTSNTNKNAGDTANAKYFARQYEKGPVFTSGKVSSDLIEYHSVMDRKCSDGITRCVGVPFAYGSAHLIVDRDSLTNCIPLNEAAWACGDRPLPYTEKFKGQQPLAKNIFANNQNYRSVSIELCCDEFISVNDSAWQQTIANSIDVVSSFIRSHNLKVDVEGSLNPQTISSIKEGCLLVVNHNDVTGKATCPLPFIKDRDYWSSYVNAISSAL